MVSLLRFPTATPAARDTCPRGTLQVQAQRRIDDWKRVAVPIGAAALLLSSSAALAADLALGEQVFSKRCVSCHVGGLNTTPNPTNWAKTLKQDALERNGMLDADAVQSLVRSGRGGMPRFRETKLSEQEVEAVASFVIEKARTTSW